MAEDKLKRYEILDKLIELLSHGNAVITWADYVIIKIEKIETEAVIKKWLGINTLAAPDMVNAMAINF